MKAWPEDLFPGGDGVVRVRSYLEAMGLLAAHRAGISPHALTASAPRLRHL